MLFALISSLKLLLPSWGWWWFFVVLVLFDLKPLLLMVSVFASVSWWLNKMSFSESFNCKKGFGSFISLSLFCRVTLVLPSCLFILIPHLFSFCFSYYYDFSLPCFLETCLSFITFFSCCSIRFTLFLLPYLNNILFLHLIQGHILFSMWYCSSYNFSYKQQDKCIMSSAVIMKVLPRRRRGGVTGITVREGWSHRESGWVTERGKRESRLNLVCIAV